MHNYEKALEEFEFAYKYDNDCHDAIRNIGIIYANMRNYKEALDSFLIIYDKQLYNLKIYWM